MGFDPIFTATQDGFALLIFLKSLQGGGSHRQGRPGEFHRTMEQAGEEGEYATSDGSHLLEQN